MVYTTVPFKLIDGLSILYRHCIGLSVTSRHVSDNEYEIERSFKEMESLDRVLGSSHF